MPPPPTFPPRTPSLEQPLVGDGEESLPLKELQARLLQCNDPLLQLVTTDNGDPVTLFHPTQSHIRRFNV